MTAIVHIKRAVKGLSPLELDLDSLMRVEARIIEISTLTATKAPELLAAFNIAYLEAGRYITLLESEYTQAKRAADRIRSIVVLDRVPQALAQRGLATAKNPAGSEDLRKAVLDGDDEYQEALAVQDNLQCYLELFKGKQKGLEMAYTSVKRLVQDQTFNFGRNVSGSGNGVTLPATDVSGVMGKARY